MGRQEKKNKGTRASDQISNMSGNLQTEIFAICLLVCVCVWGGGPWKIEDVAKVK